TLGTSNALSRGNERNNRTDPESSSLAFAMAETSVRQRRHHRTSSSSIQGRRPCAGVDFLISTRARACPRYPAHVRELNWRLREIGKQNTLPRTETPSR